MPILERCYQALHFRPPIFLARSIIAILHRHEKPEDQARLVVDQQVIPRIVVHAVGAQNRVVATQYLFLTLVFVSLLWRPERGAQIGKIVASNVDTR